MLITVTICNSQIKIGVKGGLNYSNNVFVNSDIKAQENDYVTGFNVGLFVKKEITKQINLNAEVLFSRKGFKMEAEPNAIPDSESNVQLDYINVPVLVEYTFLDKIGIETGVEFGYLLSANSVLIHKR